ncbi:patatin-like phospholipase family protein [Bradyrhizobium sp. 44]|uniref:patatin-like phospholipase family protein n=1 Tax=unclassified Bradyrhizobium TaxID=2631580 RepID=UPI001FF854CB|nr:MULTISPECIES: patatin-like phospholipase family protein [unclassified Bradyrhizobium]MCK1288991.1 patatin-like phospholipase family protein [Bradyrhizobium sp. 44]UPJ43995.1 patatin-like phospholipase family protein [Bradyrhizobium sp. 40]
MLTKRLSTLLPNIRAALLWMAGVGAAFVSNLLTLRVPLIVASAGYFMFSKPDQIQEIYFILASDLPHNLIRIGAFVVTTAVLCASINECVRQLWASQTGARLTWLRAAISAGIGMAPLAGIAVGLYRTTGYFDLPDLQQVVAKLAEKPLSPDGKTYFDNLTGGFQALHRDALFAISLLQWAAIGCLIMAVAVVVFEAVCRRRLSNPSWFRRIEANIFLITTVLVGAFSLQAVWIVKSASALLIAATALIGTLTWLSLFLVVLLFFLLRLQNVSARVGLSMAGCLVAVALVADWAGLNDNHTVRRVENKTDAETGGLIQDEFYAWWHNRPAERVKAFKDQGRPFPVYVVAARGGGIYAAYQTAITLARLYDRCPAILDHIFLISSVSGGSVGAVAFMAAVQYEPAADKTKCAEDGLDGSGTIEKLVDQFFRNDFLSPLAASALFPDFAQRFLPYPIPLFDRARAFERALEVGWLDTTSGKSDGLSQGILQGRKLGDGPIMFMNVTQAETGEQHVVAPTNDDIQWRRSAVNSANLASMGQDIALSTAATLSSRFPLILPPASVALETRHLLLWPAIATRYVDGGYFENSGADTALNVIQWIEGENPAEKVAKPGGKGIKAKKFPEYVFKMIVLGHSAYYSRLYEGAQIEANGFSELLTPVDAFMQTREVRGDQAVDRVSTLLDQPPNLGEERWRLAQINLNHRFFKFPLGWQLSSLTRRLVAANIASAGICNAAGEGAFRDSGLIEGPNAVPFGMTGFIESFQKNSCDQCKIIREVNSGLGKVKAKAKNGNTVDNCDLAR